MRQGFFNKFQPSFLPIGRQAPGERRSWDVIFYVIRECFDENTEG